MRDKRLAVGVIGPAGRVVGATRLVHRACDTRQSNSLPAAGREVHRVHDDAHPDSVQAVGVPSRSPPSRPGPSGFFPARRGRWAAAGNDGEGARPWWDGGTATAANGPARPALPVRGARRHRRRAPSHDRPPAVPALRPVNAPDSPVLTMLNTAPSPRTMRPRSSLHSRGPRGSPISRPHRSLRRRTGPARGSIPHEPRPGPHPLRRGTKTAPC
jgi:hypothetical protein